MSDPRTIEPPASGTATRDYLRTLTRAQAASEAGRWRVAVELWERVVERNPVSGNNWYWLAEARFAAGGYGGAATAYRRAVAIGVWDRQAGLVLPAELLLRIARCHAERGEPAAARAALTEALDAGLRDLDGVWADEHLSSLRSEGWFVERFGPPDLETASRVDGWRGDLRLLAREAARRSYHVGSRIDRARFDSAVHRLDQEIPQLADAQILVELKKLVRLLDDGHAFVLPRQDDAELRRALPVQFYQFAEGLFVTATAPEHGRLLGAQVLAFDGYPVDELVTALDPLIARDNEYGAASVAPQLIRQTVILHAIGVLADPARATLTARLADGATTPVSLPADSLVSQLVEDAPCPPGWRFLPYELPGDPPLYLRNPAAPYWYDLLPDQRLAYAQWNSVGTARGEPVEQFWDRLFGAVDDHGLDRLVIDLRRNGGGNTFLTVPVLHQLIGHRRVNRRGHLFVIIGRHTFSAAQNFTTALDRHTNAIFVGEPTGSRPNFVGETIPFELPYSKLLANVSDLYWQSSWPVDHRSWVAPDLYAPPTYEAFAANRDVAMEAVVAAAAHEHLPGW
ncbi:MAG: tetratricopeptide repeat protein [Micromonosporaceae bacterium]|nr:tetratricopeptide repeat protein [Micromonosporaceae bacterium]